MGGPRVESDGQFGVSTSIVVVAAAVALFACGPPELTQARVIDDLGTDELGIAFWTEPEVRATTVPCVSKRDLTSVDESRDAAVAAGWLERICKDDPDRMRLTEEGRRRSSAWQKRRPEPTDQPGTLIEWRATVARYDRTAPPIIARGEKATERLVTIPGRYIPTNEDGERLYQTGWKTIRAVDRVETFTYWRGFWARRHGD